MELNLPVKVNKLLTVFEFLLVILLVINFIFNREQCDNSVFVVLLFVQKCPNVILKFSKYWLYIILFKSYICTIYISALLPFIDKLRHIKTNI